MEPPVPQPQEQPPRPRSHTVTTTSSSFTANLSASSSTLAYDREFLRTLPGLLMVTEIELYSFREDGRKEDRSAIEKEKFYLDRRAKIKVEEHTDTGAAGVDPDCWNRILSISSLRLGDVCSCVLLGSHRLLPDHLHDNDLHQDPPGAMDHGGSLF